MSASHAYDEINKVKSVSRETVERLTIFHDLLLHWQKSINLVAPSTVDEAWRRHILDSVYICRAMGEIESLVDIGSGAGFPGLVQAIIMSESNSGSIDLIESNGKKCAFLSTVIRETGIRDSGLTIQVHNSRIEQKLSQLELPDVVSARALASLDALLKLTEPFLTRGVVGVFPKGRENDAEIELARKNWAFELKTTSNELSEGSVILEISNLSPH